MCTSPRRSFSRAVLRLWHKPGALAPDPSFGAPRRNLPSQLKTSSSTEGANPGAVKDSCAAPSPPASTALLDCHPDGRAGCGTRSWPGDTELLCPFLALPSIRGRQEQDRLHMAPQHQDHDLQPWLLRYSRNTETVGQAEPKPWHWKCCWDRQVRRWISKQNSDFFPLAALWKEDKPRVCSSTLHLELLFPESWRINLTALCEQIRNTGIINHHTTGFCNRLCCLPQLWVLTGEGIDYVNWPLQL